MKIFRTYNIPDRRYLLLRFPLGVMTSEMFQIQLSNILKDLKGVTCITGDIVIYGKDETE